MTGVSENLLIGFISGVLASIAILGVRQLYISSIVPWLEEKASKGTKIAGDWKYEMTFNPSGNQSVFRAEIEQKGERIKCAITETKTIVATNEKEIKSYKLEGEYLDRFLTLSGRDKDKNKLGVYTVLLEKKGDGKEMKGFISRHCVTTDTIKSDPITWKKI